MSNLDYSKMSLEEKRRRLFSVGEYANPDEVKFKINADFLKMNCREECYRELMVSYFPMLPLLEETVELKDADYIIYMNPYARCQDVSDVAVDEINFLAKIRKPNAEIIVVGKAANAEKLLDTPIERITFWGDHFTEKLGKKFGFDIKEQYFVYDEEHKHLAIWPVDGCLQHCKFCRRTYMDIKFESLSLDYIMDELDFIEAHSPEMLRHISLRAENLTEYGLDIYGHQELHALIKLIERYRKVKEVSLDIGMAIGEITPEILEAICKSKKISGIYLSLEAGSDRLLELIGKKYTIKHAIYVVNKIREAHPNIYIGVTVMIGLPTEEMSDIYGLADLIVKTEVDYVHCNYYIAAPRQPLAKLPQMSKSLREYHLKIFLKAVKDAHKRKVHIQHYEIFKKPKSRKNLREKDWLERVNENTLFPGHFGVETIFE